MLKAHYGIRWTAFKHNRKNQNKILPLEEKFVINNVLPGKVVALNCLGEMYRGILDVDVDLQPCNTMIMINPLNFKYKTVEQLCNEVIQFKHYLSIGGRIILNIDLTSLIYPRLHISISTLCQQIEHTFHQADFSVKRHLIPLNKTNYGYGQLYMTLERCA